MEWDKSFENIDLYEDVLKVTPEEIVKRFGRPDVIWASPDCTTYSIAAISHHRKRGGGAELGRRFRVRAVLRPCELSRSQPDHGPITYLVVHRESARRYAENGLHVRLPRHTVTYCQYGDTRMKPTDIWTNHPDPEFKPPCHNGDPCHTPAPRGAKTGTQGLSGSRERSIIPAALCEHIVEICESGDPDWGRH